MFIYAVTLRDVAQPVLHVRDKRPPRAMGRDLAKDGYLVTQAVTVRSATTAFEDGAGNTVQEDFFSAQPIGAAVLLASAVAALVEHVVPKGAAPLPDLPV